VWQFYEVKGETLTRKRKSCPRCGRGTFMAAHQDRFACGKCGYTEFKEKQSEGPA
ncbi:MAG: 30S ribosomal protein S27ae, partial [Candidatus Geothermarchaeales archaeon]